MAVPAKRLRVLVTHEPPAVFDNCRLFPTFDSSVRCPYPGWVLEILNMVASFLDLTIEPVIGQTADFGGGVGNLVNNTWRGLLGAVYNDSVDVVASLFQYTTERNEFFDFTYPVYNIKVVYLARSKRRSVASHIWSSYECYSIVLWISLFVALLIQIVVGTVIRRAEFQMGLVPHFEPFEKLWQYCRVHIHQAIEAPYYKTYAGHLAFAVFAVLQATMFSYLYQASLLASLLQRADLAPFHSAEEMIAMVRSGHYKVLATKDNYKSSWFYKELQQSNDAHFRDLREALTHNPVVLTESISSALDLLTTGEYVYPAQQDAYSAIRMREKCDLVMFDRDLPEKSAYFLFRKGSPFVRSFNYGIAMNMKFVRRTFRKYFEENFLLGRVAHCPMTEEDLPESQKPLDIVATFGIFALFLLGVAVACIVLAAEFWLYRKTRRILAQQKQTFFLAMHHKFHSLYKPPSSSAAHENNVHSNTELRATWPKAQQHVNNDGLWVVGRRTPLATDRTLTEQFRQEPVSSM